MPVVAKSRPVIAARTALMPFPAWQRPLAATGKNEAKMTALKYALIGMAALAALEFYGLLVGSSMANG
jgi:hypothetical protein